VVEKETNCCFHRICAQPHFRHVEGCVMIPFDLIELVPRRVEEQTAANSGCR